MVLNLLLPVAPENDPVVKQVPCELINAEDSGVAVALIC